MIILSNGMELRVNNSACISKKRVLSKQLKSKKARLIKKWRRNDRNYKILEIHTAFIRGTIMYVSEKTFNNLQGAYK